MNNEVNYDYQLGLKYYLGKEVEQDYAKAKTWFEKAAEQDDVNSQYMLGKMYYYGEGVKQDYPKAKTWFEKAAKQGNPEAVKALERFK